MAYRETEHLLLHAIRIKLSHADLVGSHTFDGLPEGAIVAGSIVNVSEVFDGAAATIDVGIEGAGHESDLVATATFAPAVLGSKKSDLFPVMATKQKITVTIGGAQSTTGHADVLVLYYPHES